MPSELEEFIRVCEEAKRVPHHRLDLCQRRAGVPEVFLQVGRGFRVQLGLHFLARAVERGSDAGVQSANGLVEHRRERFAELAFVVLIADLYGHVAKCVPQQRQGARRQLDGFTNGGSLIDQITDTDHELRVVIQLVLNRPKLFQHRHHTNEIRLFLAAECAVQQLCSGACHVVEAVDSLVIGSCCDRSGNNDAEHDAGAKENQHDFHDLGCFAQPRATTAPLAARAGTPQAIDEVDDEREDRENDGTSCKRDGHGIKFLPHLRAQL
mmetsp:Transcript_63501/g.184093  ORF Transcript_63501/g.184093 Transcript_63501/m.184093 type:complete len:267 (+) Transcript_63501:1559-2359(+)